MLIYLDWFKFFTGVIFLSNCWSNTVGWDSRMKHSERKRGSEDPTVEECYLSLVIIEELVSWSGKQQRLIKRICITEGKLGFRWDCGALNEVGATSLRRVATATTCCGDLFPDLGIASQYRGLFFDSAFIITVSVHLWYSCTAAGVMIITLVGLICACRTFLAAVALWCHKVEGGLARIQACGRGIRCGIYSPKHQGQIMLGHWANPRVL